MRVNFVYEKQSETNIRNLNSIHSNDIVSDCLQLHCNQKKIKKEEKNIFVRFDYTTQIPSKSNIPDSISFFFFFEKSRGHSTTFTIDTFAYWTGCGGGGGDDRER